MAALSERTWKWFDWGLLAAHVIAIAIIALIAVRGFLRLIGG